MASKSKKPGEHMFSIELKSRKNVKNFSISHSDGEVLMEGFLGRLENLRITEGLMLEINGTNGTLRMDFTEQELKTLLPKKPSSKLIGEEK